MARTKGATAEKLWTDAIRLAAHREEKVDGHKLKRISIIADKLCALAMDGDMQAIKEIGDRLEGRARQQADITSNGETIAMPKEIILRGFGAGDG